MGGIFFIISTSLGVAKNKGGVAFLVDTHNYRDDFWSSLVTSSASASKEYYC